MNAMFVVLGHIAAEAKRQKDKWGEQNHPDGTGDYLAGAFGGGVLFETLANWFRDECDRAAKEGTLTWRHILLEETFEALAEADPAKLREELIQTTAVAASWIEAIDRRTLAGTIH